MCGRYVSSSSVDAIVDGLEVTEAPVEVLERRWNVAPTQPVYAVAAGRSPGGRRLGTMRWGLVPSWAPGLSFGVRCINARAETVQHLPAFRAAFARRRCLIPADGFYEWKAGQPHLIGHRDRSPLVFAGLWETWRDLASGDAPVVRSCAIVTTRANEVVADLHDRMPVVLPADAWDEWLDRDNHDLAGLQRLLVPAPGEEFVRSPVSSRVNSVANEGPWLLDPPPDPPLLDPTPRPAVVPAAQQGSLFTLP